MAIWTAEIKDLEKLYESFKGQFPELEKELGHLIKTEDENVIMLYSRRCLEVIITDLCECELNRPRKTEPLKGIIDKLSKEGKVPSHIITSMHGLNDLSTYGTHPKDFDPEQIKPVLNNLDIIIKWYMKYKESGTDIKAKPAKEIRQEIKSTEDVKKSKTISKKRLAALLSGLTLLIVIVVAVLLFTNIIGSGKQTEVLEKSIAVLPFKLLSDEPDKQYLADGMMDAITLHLSKIKDLRVMSRTSVEQYRGTTKTTHAIGDELDVEYLLEGSFQKFGDSVRLIVQLIKTGKEGHVWANDYDRNWNNIFSVQSEVAQAIATELKAIITPEEKQLIEKPPTANLTAYDFYQRGREEYQKYWLDNDNRDALEKAEVLYHKSLKYDSTFALAYIGLAMVYYDKNFWETFYSKNFLDSVLFLCDIALSYDNQVAEVYTVKGNYYQQKGIENKAIEEYDKALKINPNSWEAYNGKGNLYSYDDLVNWIYNFQKVASLDREPRQLPHSLRRIGYAYKEAGFPEIADSYYSEAFKLDGDSVSHLICLATLENYRGNQDKELEFYKKAFTLDSTNPDILFYLGYFYSFINQYKESLKYFKKYIERIETAPEGYVEIGTENRIGYAFWQNGYKKEAEYYFNKQIENCYSMINLGRSHSQKLFSYYDLAAVYAFRGEKDKAYENLKVFNQRETMAFWAVSLIKIDPLFDSIRNEPEFQQIVRDVEAKYQAEHERVKKWLEDTGQL